MCKACACACELKFLVKLLWIIITITAVVITNKHIHSVSSTKCTNRMKTIIQTVACRMYVHGSLFYWKRQMCKCTRKTTSLDVNDLRLNAVHYQPFSSSINIHMQNMCNVYWCNLITIVFFFFFFINILCVHVCVWCQWSKWNFLLLPFLDVQWTASVRNNQDLYQSSLFSLLWCDCVLLLQLAIANVRLKSSEQQPTCKNTLTAQPSWSTPQSIRFNSFQLWLWCIL